MGKNINNKGFSLVELLAVVAIIGILAVIGIPQYHKFRVKAFQAEAKTQLAAIHTAERTFFLEHETYHPSLKAIGYAPMGRARYNIGFGYHDPSQTASATAPYIYDLNTLNSKSICAGPFGLGTDTQCQMVNDTPTIGTSATATTISYAATAVAYEEQLTASNNAPTSFSIAVNFVLGVAAQAQATSSQTPRVTVEVGSAPLGYDSWVIDHNNRLRKAYLDNSIDCETAGTCEQTTPYDDPNNTTN